MNGSDIKCEKVTPKDSVDIPLTNLSISKVDRAKISDITAGLSRNNTISSLLNHDKSHR